MVVDVVFRVSPHERQVLQSFEEHEVEDGCDGDAAEQAHLPAQVFRDAEREDDAREVLYQRTEQEGNRYTQEDAEYHL